MAAFRALELLIRPPYNCQSAGLDSSKDIELLIHISLNSESIYSPNRSTPNLTESPTSTRQKIRQKNFPGKSESQNRTYPSSTVSNRAHKMTLIQRLSLVGLIALIVSILLHFITDSKYVEIWFGIVAALWPFAIRYS